MGILRTVKNKIYTEASKHISRATLLEGLLKGTGQTFRCLFVEKSNLMRYLSPRIYSEPPTILESRKIWIPSLKKTVSDASRSMDICIAVLPKQYDSEFQPMDGFKSQEDVRQVIDTSGSMEEIMGAFHQKKRQWANTLIKRNDLTCRISRDLRDLDLFYHRMHVPHIQKRYGDLSYLESFEEMKTFFLKGFLLLVLKGGEAIAGALCLTEGDALTFRRTGVLHGDESYVKMGAQLALYYFNIVYAKEHGIGKVDAMKSRPFLNDGVYRTKREWGAAVLPDDEAESWVYYFNLGAPDKMAHFYEQNPVIVHTKTGLKGIVGVSKGSELSPEVQSDLTDRYYAPGLNGLMFLTPKSKIPIEVGFRKNEKDAVPLP